MKRKSKKGEKRLSTKPTGASTPVPQTVPSFREALRKAGILPKIDAAQDAKKNYAERLSNSIAILVANKLRAAGNFKGILPNSDGSGRESKAQAGKEGKMKKTDVRYGTLDTGLELLVSIKTISFRDYNRKTRKIGRYTKNMVRNDHELRAEAQDHHDRHPFAVLVGLVFLPFDSCDDAVTGTSSFGHSIVTFRPRSGRTYPRDAHELFEKIYIGLYERDEQNQDDTEGIAFFDVQTAPPRRGRPKKRSLLSLDEMIKEIVKVYGIRTQKYIEWSEEESGVEAVELEPSNDEDADESDEV